jgi:DNA segregation ATPase FtsK/SpoIIIE, S-DNA-T family
VLVLLEFVVFGAVAAGTLIVQDRLKGGNSERHYIEKAFRNIGAGVPQRDKEGNVTAVFFPKYIGKRVHDWGIQYRLRLPVGTSYKTLMESKPIQEIIEGMLYKDVEIEDLHHNVIGISVYKEKLPTLIPYDLSWLNQCKGYKVVIGMDHKKLIFHDFSQIPHMIIGGMTRYGKSVVMKLLITQLLLCAPKNLKFHLFDLKGGLAFNRFKKLPQVNSVSRDVKESLANLKTLKGRIKKRQLYFEKKGYEDIGEANAAGEKFEREIVIVDEASVLAPKNSSDQDRNKCRDILEYIAQVAGGLGFNLIMCSQYPTGDILPRQVKQNSDARLSFRLPTTTASGVILDEPGAEDIPYGLKGRAIYKTDIKKMIQVPFMENKIIDGLLSPFKMEEEEHDHEPTEENGEGRSNTAEPEEIEDCEQKPVTIDPFAEIK